MFGGGAALAKVCETSGLTTWVAEGLAGLNLAEYWFVLVETIVVTFTTEFVSNLAALSIFGPIVAAVASAKQFDPVKHLLVVTFASSYAFMLPMAGGPNMTVFSTGKVSFWGMARTGIMLNVFAIIMGSLYMHFVSPYLLGDDYGDLPVLGGQVICQNVTSA